MGGCRYGMIAAANLVRVEAMDDMEFEARGESASGDEAPRAVRTRAADVLARLRGDIAEGRLLPGQRLHLDELSRRYGAGYSPIREALSRLAADGLVVLAEYKGYRVAPISREDWLDILMMRKELEPKALGLSMQSESDACRASVGQCLAELAAQPSNLDDGRVNPEWERCHRAFHRCLVSGCHSAWLLRFIDTLTEQSHRYLRSTLTGQLLHEKRDHLAEHRAIVAAVEENDVELATALLRNHLSRSGKMLAHVAPQIFIES